MSDQDKILDAHFKLQDEYEQLKKELEGFRAIIATGPEGLKHMIDTYEDMRKGMNKRVQELTADRQILLEALEKIAVLNDEGPYQAIKAPRIASEAIKEVSR